MSSRLRPSAVGPSARQPKVTKFVVPTEAPQGPLPDYFEVPKRKGVLTIKAPNGETFNADRDASQSDQLETTSALREVKKRINRVSHENNAVKAGKATSEQRPFQPAKDSKLNIYAPVHVPDWLIAVNESPALQIVCKQLDSFDARAYAVSFGALAHVEPVHVRPPIPIEVSSSDFPILTAQNYETYFFTRIHDEIASQGSQMAMYSLYQHFVALKDPRQFLFEIKVPGLREHSPRIDLGDVVLVRAINPSLPPTAIAQNKIWREQMHARGATHPALFLGTEFRAVVWGLHRATEAVMLRIDVNGPLTPLPPFANFRFFQQAHKTEPLLRVVQSIHIALSSSETLRPMLFPQRLDACMQTKLSPSTFDLNWWDKSLNFEQQKAVAQVMANRYGTVPYLISGPPGTGKTKTIVETALQLIVRNKAGVFPHILICAPSDAAADTLALRLSTHLKHDQLFRLNGWNRTFAEVPDKLLLYSYSGPNNMFSLPPFHQLMSYTVVVATCRSASMLVEARLANKDLAQLAFNSLESVSPSTAKSLTTPLLHWTALLLDEAAQATEPESLIPLSIILPLWQPPSCKLTFPQFVLAGDEYQLGPRLTSKTGLEISLFQRLFNLPFYATHPLSRANGLQPLTRKLLPLPRPPFTNLIRNYRSHPTILSIPSSLFYYDTLIPEYAPSTPTISTWRGWPNPLFPILFIHHSGPDEVDDILIGDGTGAGSLYNDSEIDIVMRQVLSLLSHSHAQTSKTHPTANSNTNTNTIKPTEIMIMSPFAAQVARLRTRLRKEGLASVNVGPLEAFQGLESRVVILCTTRTRRGREGDGADVARFVKMDQERGLGVVDEPKRFNVAITRAMEGLVVVGDARTLVCTGDVCWRGWVAFCVRNGLVEGELGGLREEVEGWGAKEGRLERALRQKGMGEGSGKVMGLRGFVEVGDEEGEMTLPEDEGGVVEGEEVDDDFESDEELDDEYQTLEGLNIDGAVM